MMETNATKTQMKTGFVKQILIVISAILLYGIIAGIHVNSGLLSSIIISHNTGMDYGEVSLAFSIMNIVLACSIPVLAILTLKIQHFYLFIGGVVLCALGLFGMSISKNVIDLIISIGFIFGIGSSVLSFTMVYSAAKQFFGTKGSTILSGVLLSAQGALGLGFSSIIGITRETIGLNQCLIIISITAVCLIPFTFIFLKRKQPQESPEKVVKSDDVKISHVLKKMVTSPFIHLLLIGVIAFGMGDGILVNHLAQAVYTYFNVDESILSIVASIYTISIMVGSLFGGFIAAKVKNKALTLAYFFLGIFLINIFLRVLEGIYTNTDINTISILVQLMVICFLCGFLLNASYVLIIALAVIHVSNQVCAVILGIFESVGFLLYSLNIFLGGVLFNITNNFFILNIIVFTLCAISGILFLIYGIRQKEEQPKIYF